MSPDLIGAGIFAIVGAFIGGGSAAFAAYLADKRRFKREDEYRDYADRRQAYLDFLASWHAREFARTLPPTVSSNLEALEEAKLGLQRTFNALSLIAPEDVRTAADGMQKDAEGAPGRFWKAARKDLGKELPRKESSRALEKADDEL